MQLPAGVQETRFPTYVFGNESIGTEIFARAIFERNAKTQQAQRRPGGRSNGDGRPIELLVTPSSSQEDDGKPPTIDLLAEGASTGSGAQFPNYVK